MLPLHIKLGLMKNFVKAMPTHPLNTVEFRCKKFPKVSKAKLKEEIIVGPQILFYLFIFYFISIFILLTRRKAMEALIHRVGNYPDLLPEIPRYCCPLVS